MNYSPRTTMTEPTSEAYEAAARAYCLIRFDYLRPAYISDEAHLDHIAVDVSSTTDQPWLRAAVDAVWDLAEATVRAKVAAEIRSACLCTDPDGCAYQVSAEIAEGPNAPEHRPVRRRLTLLHADDEGGGTSSWGYLTCATCFPSHIPVPIGADPNWPCAAARIAEGKGDENTMSTEDLRRLHSEMRQRTELVGLRLTPEEHAQAESRAAEADVTVQELIRRLLSDVADREGICGDESANPFNCSGTLAVICHLRFGHGSKWHESETGQRWKYHDDDPVATIEDLQI